MVKSEKISILSSGVRLGGTFFYPETPKRTPGVCICHGIPRVNKPVEEKGYPFLAKKFCERKYAALIFNFQGTSGSEGEFSFSAWSRNVLDAISYLASSPRIDPKRLGLVSFSAGAFVSWSVVANDSRIKAFASCSSPSDFRKIPFIEEGIKYLKKFGILKITNIKKTVKGLRSDLRELRPLQWVGKISPRPVLIVHGDQDDVIPVQSAHKLYENAKEPKKILIFKNVNHQIRNNQEAMDAVVEWTVKNI
ncbi:MAG: alpha/beta hydrolase family protein [Candidatus Lokiarchaeia archaeon]